MQTHQNYTQHTDAPELHKNIQMDQNYTKHTDAPEL